MVHSQSMEYARRLLEQPMKVAELFKILQALSIGYVGDEVTRQKKTTAELASSDMKNKYFTRVAVELESVLFADIVPETITVEKLRFHNFGEKKRNLSAKQKESRMKTIAKRLKLKLPPLEENGIIDAAQVAKIYAATKNALIHQINPELMKVSY
jgi:hypothetical protein